MEQSQQTLSIANTISCKTCKIIKFNVSCSQIDLSSNFFTYEICSNCDNKTFYLFCECESVISSANSFFQGQIIQCKNKDCDKSFQLVQCPSSVCKKYCIFYKENRYKMGFPVECESCLCQFQQVSCHYCFASNYFKGTYQETVPIICSNFQCKKSFQHINCPYPTCQNPNIDQKLQPGKILDCSKCQGKISFQNCPNCLSAQILDDKNSQLGQYFKCKCDTYFSFDECRKCHKFNIRKERNVVYNKVMYGKRQCNYESCKQISILFKCCNKQCLKQNNQLCTEKKDVFTVDCEYCKLRQFLISCPNCKGGFIHEGKELHERPINCTYCDNLIVHDINYSLSEGKSNNQCKICLEKEANFMMVPCYHVFGCQQCTEHSGITKCPICRAQGKIQRIYI